MLASYKEGSWIRLIGQILGLGSAALGLMSQFGSRTSRTVLGANDSWKDSTQPNDSFMNRSGLADGGLAPGVIWPQNSAL